MHPYNFFFVYTAYSITLHFQVSVFSPSNRKHYLNITPSNIVSIYTPKVNSSGEINVEKVDLHPFQPEDFIEKIEDTVTLQAEHIQVGTCTNTWYRTTPPTAGTPYTPPQSLYNQMLANNRGYQQQPTNNKHYCPKKSANNRSPICIDEQQPRNNPSQQQSDNKNMCNKTSLRLSGSVHVIDRTVCMTDPPLGVASSICNQTVRCNKVFTTSSVSLPLGNISTPDRHIIGMYNIQCLISDRTRGEWLW